MTVDAPAERVFEDLTDDELLTHWMEGVVEVRPVTDEGHRVGAKSIAIVDQDGSSFELPTEVMETTKNESLAVQITNPMFVVVNRYQLTETSAGTRVVQTMDAEYSGVARLFGSLAGSSIQQQLDGDFTRLQAAVESFTLPLGGSSFREGRAVGGVR